MSEETFLLPLPAVVDVIVGRACLSEQDLRLRHYRRKRHAPDQVDELLASGGRDLHQKLKRSRGRLFSRPLVEALIQRCGELTSVAPEEAVEAARAAQMILSMTAERLGKRQLSVEFGGGCAWWDLQGLVRAQLANVRRVQCRWADARQGFDNAYQCLSHGTGDPLAAARVRCLEASLLRDREKYQRALQCLSCAEILYRRLDHQQELARVLLKRAEILDLCDQVRRAIQIQIEAIALIDEDREPAVTLAAFANLAEMYRRGGEAEAAAVVLESSEHYLQDLPAQSRTLLTWRWIRGRVNLALGRLQEARSDLVAAFDGYRAANSSFQFASIGVDLMKLYALEGRTQELVETSGPTLQALRNQDLAAEAVEAIAVLSKALEYQQVGTHLVDQLAELIEKKNLGRERR
ncbi:MAG: hypothetical protein SX243_24295 [Acidobacteriota bacterium]|nr:hypothetical protein [Acidobacteriota bacterium]